MPTVRQVAYSANLPYRLPDDRRMAKKPSRSLQVLAENLERLMGASLDLNSQPRLAARTKIDQKTIWRILHRQNEPSIDKVEKIAAAFGFEPWQLLVPKLDPLNKPELAQEATYSA